ncbi:MAG: cbb3-type cytochrome oxidase assembly protein CcoS [Verrucomicrobiota bacterium]
MSVLVFLIFASLAVALVFLGAFLWAVRSGQYDDTSTPSLRVLGEETSSAAPAPAEAAPLSTHSPTNRP